MAKIQQNTGKVGTNKSPSFLTIFVIFMIIFNTVGLVYLSFKLRSAHQKIQKMQNSFKSKLQSIQGNQLAMIDMFESNEQKLLQKHQKHQQVIKNQHQMLIQLVDAMYKLTGQISVLKNEQKSKKGQQEQQNEWYSFFAQNLKQSMKSLTELELLKEAEKYYQSATEKMKESMSNLKDKYQNGQLKDNIKSMYKNANDFVSENIQKMKIKQEGQNVINKAKNIWENSKKKWKTYFDQNL